MRAKFISADLQTPPESPDIMPDTQPADSAPKCGIFLSYRTTDRPFVERLHERLKEWGYHNIFQDSHPEDGIKGGEDANQSLYRNLDTKAVLIVVCSQHTKESKWVFFETNYARANHKTIIPLKIDDCQLDDHLKDFQAIDLLAEGEEAAFERLKSALEKASVSADDSFYWQDNRPPYPGLDFFREEDVGVYFGRDKEIASTRKTLEAMAAGRGPRLALVIGSSGSGKSSLVRAGVVPRLKWMSGGTWRVIPPFRPQKTPILALAQALAAALDKKSEWEAIHQKLLGDTGTAARALVNYAHDLRMTGDRLTASVLVVVDQFEELLADKASDEVTAFHGLLRRALEIEGSPLQALGALRSDFLGSFQTHKEWLDREFALVSLGPMTRSRFAEVIETPAARAGVKIEPGLVEKIVQDAETDDALPLLAFTLREMYDLCKQTHTLTHFAYDDGVRGIRGAVERVVERIKEKVKLTDEMKTDVRRAFLKLVEVNENRRFVRRPAALADLPAGSRQFVAESVDSRLLTRGERDGQPTVEVVHESLFHVWPELNGWLTQSLEFFLWKRRVRDDPDYRNQRTVLGDHLLSKARLAEAEKWLAERPDDLEEGEKEFIKANLAESKRLEREEQLRQERELETQKNLRAEAEGRARQEKTVARLLRGGLFGLTGAVAILIALAWYANSQRQDADAQRAKAQEETKIAVAERIRADDRAKAARDALEENEKQRVIGRSRGLASLSVLENDNYDRSLLLAVEAFRTKDTFEARNCLFRALQEFVHLRGFLHLNGVSVTSTAFSPDGKTLATGYSVYSVHRKDEGGGVVLWDVTTGRRLRAEPLLVREGFVWSVCFSPDGKTLATGYRRLDSFSGGGVVLWDVATGTRLRAELLVEKDGVKNLCYSPDGKTLAAEWGRVGSVDWGGVVLWDVATATRLRVDRLSLNEGKPGDTCFSRDGKILAAGYCEYGGLGGVVLWDVAAGKRLRADPLLVKEGRVKRVSFSPDGKTLAAGLEMRAEGGVVLWDVATGRRLRPEPLSVKEGFLESVCFFPDGELLAVGWSYGIGHSMRGGVILWGVTAGERLRADPLPRKEGFVGSMCFSPDGRTLAATFDIFGADSPEGGVLLWDMATGIRLRTDPLTIKEGHVRSVCLGPDDKTLTAMYATNAGCGIVQCDLATEMRLRAEQIPVNEGSVESVSSSPDGKTLAIKFNTRPAKSNRRSAGGGVVLWDVDAGTRLRSKPLNVNEGSIGDVCFSSDSKTLATGYIGRGEGSGGGAVLWDVSTGRRLPTEPLSVKEGSLRSVCFSPDGKTLATGYHGHESGSGGGVVLWDVATGTRLRSEPIFVKEGGVDSMSFSPDGRTLAIGVEVPRGRGGLVLWDVAAGTRLRAEPLPLKEGNVIGMCFTPDGKALVAGVDASGDRSGAVVVWDLATQKRLSDKPIVVNEGNVRCVSLSSSGGVFAVGLAMQDGKGGVVLCDLDPESWQRRVGQIANRNLTREEWRQYLPGEPYRPTFPDLPVPPE
jgi:WD40 repeat protein